MEGKSDFYNGEYARDFATGSTRDSDNRDTHEESCGGKLQSWAIAATDSSAETAVEADTSTTSCVRWSRPGATRLGAVWAGPEDVSA